MKTKVMKLELSQSEVETILRALEITRTAADSELAKMILQNLCIKVSKQTGVNI